MYSENEQVGGGLFRLRFHLLSLLHILSLPLTRPIPLPLPLPLWTPRLTTASKTSNSKGGCRWSIFFYNISFFLLYFFISLGSEQDLKFKRLIPLANIKPSEFPCVCEPSVRAMYVCMYVCMCVCVYVGMYTYVCIRMYVCMYTYVYVCIYTYVTSVCI